jgi:hypothetical protein
MLFDPSDINQIGHYQPFPDCLPFECILLVHKILEVLLPSIRKHQVADE